MLNHRRGLNLILLGILLIEFYLGWQYHQARILSFTAKDKTAITQPFVGVKRGFVPVRVNIPSHFINLAVKEASIKDGVWQVWEGVANHLDTSANVGGGGNIVIYGHNKNSVFGPIRWLSAGEIITLSTANGTNYEYRVVATAEVSPDNLEYILPKDTETLTLYTCSGLFDSKRFVVVAKPLN